MNLFQLIKCLILRDGTVIPSYNLCAERKLSDRNVVCNIDRFLVDEIFERTILDLELRKCYFRHAVCGSGAAL